VANAELTLEQRIERIERVLIVQGFLEWPKPPQAPVEVPRLVARNTKWAPDVPGLAPTVLVTVDCTCVKRCHQISLIASQMRRRVGQVLAATTECGKSIEVEIPREE
jgi:hypothetical protein